MKSFLKKSFVFLLAVGFVVISMDIQSYSQDAETQEKNREWSIEYQKYIDIINKEYEINLKIEYFRNELPLSLFDFIDLLYDYATVYKKQNTYAALFEEPDHDKSIVIFKENEEIDFYVNFEKYIFEENQPYIIRVRNHDELFVPLEELMRQLEIKVIWDKETETVTIYTDDIEIYIEIKENRWSRSNNSSIFLPLDDSVVIRDDCLYVNPYLFRSMFDQCLFNIYHNLHKASIVSNGILKGLTINEHIEISNQYARADYPLYEPVGIYLEGEIIEFPENIPYITRTASRDYVMIPLIEFEKELGIKVEWDAVKNVASIMATDGRYNINTKDGSIEFNNELLETIKTSSGNYAVNAGGVSVILDNALKETREAAPPAIKNGCLYFSDQYIYIINKAKPNFNYEMNQIEFSPINYVALEH